MKRTRAYKETFIKQKENELDGARVLIFTDVSGTSVNELNSLRSSLGELGAKFEVIKKRLLRVIFNKKNLGFNPELLNGQLGVVVSDKEMYEIAGRVYKFTSGSKTFRILGGFELNARNFIEGDAVEAIGKLPSRDILLGQVVGAIAGPLRAFLYVLKEKSKQTI